MTYAVIAYDPDEPADTIGFLSSIEREGRARLFSDIDAAEQAALEAEEKHPTSIAWMVIDLGNIGANPNNLEDTGTSQGIVA